MTQSTTDPIEIENEPLSSIVDESHLHPATLCLPILETAFSALGGLLIASFFVGPVKAFGGFGVFVLLPMAIFHAVSFFTLTYRIAGRELVVRSGLLSRRERRIPMERIQEVEIRQSLIYRLVGLAKVNLSTAGSDDQEATLNAIKRSSAEHLKSVLTNSPAASRAADVVSDVQVNQEDNFDYAVDLRTLLLGGLTSRIVATLGAIASAIVYFQFVFHYAGNWMGKFTGRLDSELRKEFNQDAMVNRFLSDVPDSGVVGFAIDVWEMDTLWKSILLAIVGFAAATAMYAIRYAGFRISRRADLLTTAYGLLTYHHGSLSRDRIQALKLEEPLLRRWFDLASVRVDSAGDHSKVDDQKKRDVLIPVADRATAQEVVRQAIPGLNQLDPTWHRMSPLAIGRRSRKGWLLCGIVMVATFWMTTWYCLVWLPAFPAVYFLNRKWYQHTGYWIGDDHVIVRSGWLNRSTLFVPIRNIQSVTFSQNWFDRRLNLASLSVDIAGQSNTGGGPSLNHLPVLDAKSMQQRLALEADKSEFRW